MGQIALNISTILDKIAKAQVQYNKENVSLLCVSKTKPIEAIKEAYDCGQRHFGENYVQEANEKIPAFLQKYNIHDITWHFIGPIQSNKSRIIANLFDVVESVDRIKIAKRLNEQRDSTKGPLSVLIQVNISNEDQKSGCSLDDVEDLINYIVNECENLQLHGFMVIAKDTDNKDEIKKEFISIYKVFEHYNKILPHFDTLSMGMTHDMQEAICCGSTQIRIGTAIFGARDYSKRV